MTQRRAPTGGGDLCFETFGDEADPTVVLISGMSASMDWWDRELCERLADRGRHVVRYDHRDTGASVHSPVGRPDYTAHDLATDPLRVLDACGVSKAHLVGISMGGGIAQQLAAQHADRVHTITLIATSPAGDRCDDAKLPPPEPRVAAMFEDPGPDPDWDDATAVVEHLVESERLCNGTLPFDVERMRAKATAVVTRSADVAAGLANHPILDEDPADRFRMADISVPTLVLHGTADPLFPHAHGVALAAEIPGARLVSLDGMGHQVPPPQLWDVVIAEIADHTAPGGTR